MPPVQPWSADGTETPITLGVVSVGIVGSVVTTGVVVVTGGVVTGGVTAVDLQPVNAKTATSRTTSSMEICFLNMSDSPLFSRCIVVLSLGSLFRTNSSDLLSTWRHVLFGSPPCAAAGHYALRIYFVSPRPRWTRTAAIMTKPLTAPCRYAETFSQLSMLLTTPRMMTPMTVPQIHPRPPFILVPPMTTAAIASSSRPAPKLELLTALMRELNISAMRNTPNPKIMYAMTLMRSVLMAE